jgi:hypothetical protein
MTWEEMQAKKWATTGPQAGEKWHVRYKGAKALATVEIKEATEKTVVVSDSDWLNGTRSRYAWGDLEFVEKVTAA